MRNKLKCFCENFTNFIKYDDISNFNDDNVYQNLKFTWKYKEYDTYVELYKIDGIKW